MCLFPLSIRNPTKVINTDGGQLLKMQVPCGHCAQCLRAKRNEWYIRSHYEMQRTFSLGGYVYFDTLTYADEHLPKLSHFIDIKNYGLADFSCFNHTHFKAFLKRLRRRIAHHYHVDSSAFRYFLTTEYGEDDRYTHRPHYHILFFVYADIDPLKFSQLVADCWQYGRTDGFPYKPDSYVYRHVYGRKYGETDNKDFPTTSAVCMYVSKYITKHSKFTKVLDERMKELRNKLMCYNRIHHLTITQEDEDMLKELKRNIDMFHRQSQGFGLSYIDNLTPEKLMFLETDQMIMKDRDKIVKTYPLPMYYKRHLFYINKKHTDGSRYWELSHDGLNHVLNAKFAKVDKITIKYMDIVRNCTDKTLVDEFFRLLGKRDISDYVVYEQFYKGRHRHPDSINYKQKTSNQTLNDEEINLNDWLSCLSRGLRPYACLGSSLQNNDSLVRQPLLSQEEKVKHEEHFYKHGHFLDMLGNSERITYDEYIKYYTFNEDSDADFAHFDKIGILISLMTDAPAIEQQITFEFLEDLKEKYKILFN